MMMASLLFLPHKEEQSKDENTTSTSEEDDCSSSGGRTTTMKTAEKKGEQRGEDSTMMTRTTTTTIRDDPSPPAQKKQQQQREGGGGGGVVAGAIRGRWDNNNNVDALGHVAQFLDYASAAAFVDVVLMTTTTTTQSSLLPVTDDGAREVVVPAASSTSSSRSALEHVWKVIFDRHGFSPLDVSNNNADNNNDRSYREEIAYRRRLSERLIPGYYYHDCCCCDYDYRQTAKPQRKRLRRPRPQPQPGGSGGCFSLNDGRYSFSPVTPDFDDGDLAGDDPPPVRFDCDSFLLTSTATSSEFAFLNPFTGTFSVRDSVALERRGGRRRRSSKEPSSREQQQVQVLISRDDRWNLPLSEYGFDGPIEDVEADVAYLGIESKSVFRRRVLTGERDAVVDEAPAAARDGACCTTSTFVSVGRRIANVRNEGENSVVEVLAWRKKKRRAETGTNGGGRRNADATAGADDDEACTSANNKRNENVEDDGGTYYGDRRVCRFRRDFWALDFGVVSSASTSSIQQGTDDDSVQPKLFVNYLSDSADVGNQEAEGRRFSQECGSSRIAIYPFVSYPPSPSVPHAQYFPDPETTFDCRERVTSMMCSDQDQLLLVGTARKSLQIWNLNAGRDSSCHPQLVEAIDILKHVKSAFKRRGLRLPNNAAELSPINAFRTPRHLSIENGGFVTHHHSRFHGNTLLLWKKSICDAHENFRRNEVGKEITEPSYAVVSMINLPLNERRYSEFFYDGRRLIVFGQDHIGMLLLVYRVCYSAGEEYAADADVDPPAPSKSASNPVSNASDDGGVYHLTASGPTRPLLRLARVIRHAALGGLDRTDGLHMTCNERYIVVNTKAGNLLNESRAPYSDGLLVIDLGDTDDGNERENNP